jgi:hypothetical protein
MYIYVYFSHTALIISNCCVADRVLHLVHRALTDALVSNNFTLRHFCARVFDFFIQRAPEIEKSGAERAFLLSGVPLCEKSGCAC